MNETPNVGDRIILVKMEGEDMPPGTKGTVEMIDDAGNIHVRWDNGRRLSLLPDVDKWIGMDSRYIQSFDDFNFYG